MLRAAGRHVAVLALMMVLAIWHTWPLFPLRKTHLLGGSWEDPWLNAWHVDWMYRSIRDGHTPFFAADLHWPLGAEMYWHSQAPAKTILAVVLLPLTGGNVIEASNLILLSTFVLAGLTAWWLIRDVLRRAGRVGDTADAAAFIGACAFNFSRYHYCHAHAHMNLAAIEALPAFVLCALRFLESENPKRSWGWLVGAGIAGLYAMGCDLYYAYYLSLFLLAWVVLQLSREGAPLLRRETLWHPLVRRTFVLSTVSALSCLPIALPLVRHLRPAPWSIHGSSMYPADPIMLVAPDVLSYWARFFPAVIAEALRKLEDGILNDIEGGLFIGLVAIGLGVFGARRESASVVRPWIWIGLGFLVLSLGPFLHIGGEDALPAQILIAFVAVGLLLSKRVRQSARGREVLILVIGLLLFLAAFGMKEDGKATTIRIPMPYLFFKHVAPFFSRGGMPVRFLLMTQLCLSVLLGFGVLHAVERARERWRGARPVAALAGAFVLVNLETMNKPFEMTPVKPPVSVFETIRADPEPTVAVFTDHVLGQFEQLYHRRPISFARQSRTPIRELPYVQSALQKILVDFARTDALTSEEIDGMRAWLRQNGFRYFVGHQRAYIEAMRWRRATEDSKQRRELFLRDALKAELIYEDADLQVFRFW